MDPLLLSILITLALRRAIENGKAEYTYVRDQRAAELARTYPQWSPGRVKRVARRAARRYWWGQIRGGFPEVRAAYTESKELAEAVRVEAEAAGLRRRAEIRERIRKALEEAEQIRDGERRRATGAPKDDADDTAEDAAGAREHAADDPAEPTPRGPEDPAGAAAQPSATEPPEEKKTQPGDPKPDDPASDPTIPQPCGDCGEHPAWPRWDGTHTCDPCWETRSTALLPKPGAAPADNGGGATIIPLKPPQAPASAPSTEGDTMTIPTGEYTGYDAAVADWKALEQLSQDLQVGYDRLMANYRAMNVDDQTIERAAACREAEEQHLLAVQAASGDFVTRHGAVKETKESTGAQGDQVVYNP